MLKLAKYLKPYIWLVVMCVALVFVQAMCDLKLPDYMSDIVNVGVMNYGIEDAVPDKLREETLEKLFLFMSADEKEVVSSYYAVTSVAPASPSAVLADSYAEYQRPQGLDKETIESQRQIMNAAFSRGFLVLAAIDQGMMPESVPEGADFLALLSQMPEEARMEVIGRINAQMGELGESAAGQVAVLALKAEYEALGLDVSAIQRGAVLRIGGKMLLVALVICLCAIGAGFLSARTAAGFARDIRDDIFHKVTTFSSAEINDFSTASLITRTTNDVQQIQMVVTMMLRMVIYAPIMGVGGVIYAVQKSVSMSWIIALAVLVLIMILVVLMIVVMPKFKKIQKLVDRLNLVARENISGTMVSRAYNTQSFEMERFDGANRAYAQNSLFVNRAMDIMMPFMNLIMSTILMLIIWFGAHEIAESTLQVGDMMAYTQYAMQVIMSFLFVSMMFVFLPRAAVSGERIAQVLYRENSIKDPDAPADISALPAEKGVVRFDNVSFRYPGAEKDTLLDISFKALPGQTTAIIGSTGSGKTTLASLIMRFYDVTGGSVKVNGVDVRDMRQHDLRGQIGFVPQKSVLFSGTIADNIRFGAPDASQEQVEAAAETAQAAGFIHEKEDGFGEHISQGGTNVSGGQRQRLSIARALAVDANILIFDDSFSALDFKTDAALRRALKASAADATIIVVAQRVGTIMGANQIIVLDEGKIAGLGTHAHLMESCEVYREIARSQLREEELGQ